MRQPSGLGSLFVDRESFLLLPIISYIPYLDKPRGQSCDMDAQNAPHAAHTSISSEYQSLRP